MKSRIVPIAIIVALIAIFVIIDRKEFNRDNVVQSVQTDSKASSNSHPIDFQHVGQMGGRQLKQTPRKPILWPRPSPPKRNLLPQNL